MLTTLEVSLASRLFFFSLVIDIFSFVLCDKYERENLYVMIYTCSAHLAALDAVRCAGTLWSPASVLHAVHLSQDVWVGGSARSIQYHNTLLSKE